MSNLFSDLTIIEEDHEKLESINRLQNAFNDVKQGYQAEYKQSLTHVIDEIKTRMKNNAHMVSAVDGFVDKYVTNPTQRGNAKEELYGMLAAEMMSMLQALKHVNCVIS